MQNQKIYWKGFDMYGYIYRITDLTNGKCYIGQHKYDKPMLDPKYHGSGKIIKQIHKKRPNTLMEEILMICATLDEANYFEQYFIEHMNTLVPYGYNFQKGGDCHEGQIPWQTGLTKETDERIQKMTLKSRLTKGTKEWKTNHSGENACFYGKHHTKESKTKMSKAKKGKYLKEERYNYVFIPFEDLYELKVNQRKTNKEVAEIFNTAQNTITLKCREYNINSDTRGRIIIQCDANGDFIREFNSIAEAAKILNIPHKSIRESLRLGHKGYGYIWKYK